MNGKIAIIISTYNGENFIEQQIDSLLRQTYKNYDIFIRDDGSSDLTCSILEKYKEYSFIHIEYCKNIGFIKSFWELLKNAEDYSYYAYCDQDDVWMDNKLENAVKFLSGTPEENPVMFFSGVEYCDINMKHIGSSDKNKNISFQNALVECCSQGMTMVINKKTRDMIISAIPEHCLYHDWWTYMICSSMGEIVFDKSDLVKYRRHGRSVTAEGTVFVHLLFWRIKTFFVNDSLKQIKKQLQDFKRIYGNFLSAENMEALNLFTYSGYNFLYALKKCFYRKRFRNRISDEIVVRILCLLGKL